MQLWLAEARDKMGDFRGSNPRNVRLVLPRLLVNQPVASIMKPWGAKALLGGAGTRNVVEPGVVHETTLALDMAPVFSLLTVAFVPTGGLTPSPRVAAQRRCTSICWAWTHPKARARQAAHH